MSTIAPSASGPQPEDHDTPNSQITAENPSLSALRRAILTHLAQAVDAAAQRLAQAAPGQSLFASDADLKATLALLNFAPTLLPLLPQYDDDEDDEFTCRDHHGTRRTVYHPSHGADGPRIMREYEEMRREDDLQYAQAQLDSSTTD